MKRYEVNHNGKITIEENGQWVKYDEAQARVDVLEKALKGFMENAEQNYPELCKSGYYLQYEQAKQALRNDE